MYKYLYRYLPMEQRLPTEDELEAMATSRSGWIGRIYRVAPSESLVFWRLGTMFALIAFIYSIMRCVKDAVVSEVQMPASITYLKITFVMPASLAAVAIISFFISKKAVAAVLQVSTLLFGLCFLGYVLTSKFHMGFMIFNAPFKASDYFGDGKMDVRSLNGLFPFALCLNFYPSSLLYVMSELWGSIVLSFLFMTYCNEVLTFKQSLRFLPLFYVLSNVGLFFSGLTIFFFARYKKNAPFHMRSNVVNIIIGICAVLTLIIFFMHRQVDQILKNRPLVKKETVAVRPQTKVKRPGFVDGIVYLLRSKVLLAWAAMTLGYNICTNLLDGVFKPVMKAFAEANLLETSQAVMDTEAIMQMITALVVILILCTPFSRIIQSRGWSFAGFITPIWTILSSLFILSLACYNTGTKGKNSFGFINTWLLNKTDFIPAELVIGAICVCGMKIGKYAFFDMTKEALAMRIESKERKLAKSIVDGICGKMGKSGGSIINTLIFNITGNNDLRSSSLVLFIFLFGVCFVWTYTVKYLNSKYNESLQTNKPIDLAIIGTKTI